MVHLHDYYDITILYFENLVIEIGGMMKKAVHKLDGVVQIHNDLVQVDGMYQVKLNGKLHVIQYQIQVVQIILQQLMQ